MRKCEKRVGVLVASDDNRLLAAADSMLIAKLFLATVVFFVIVYAIYVLFSSVFGGRDRD